MGVTLETYLAEKYVLVVSFDSYKFADSTVQGIVGRVSSGSGTNLESMERDMSFEFKDEKEAKKALERAKKSKIYGKVHKERK